jgi:hypothetical protein
MKPKRSKEELEKLSRRRAVIVLGAANKDCQINWLLGTSKGKFRMKS